MQIYCPKCKTGYAINAEVVPEKGRKLRCSVCEKIFHCLPDDLTEGSKMRMAEFTEEEKKQLNSQGMLTEEVAFSGLESNEEVLPTKSLEDLEAEEKNKEALEVQDIFKRLSEETEALFQVESEAKPVKKIISDAKKSLGLLNPRNYKYYILMLLLFLSLFLAYSRYDVVRKYPAMENIYGIFGIQSRVIGEGLEFQNINRREFEEDDINKFEIKGFIANNTDRTLDIPTIYVELLDADVRSVQTISINSVIPLVAPHSRVALSFIITKPSPLTKYIYLTFTENRRK